VIDIVKMPLEEKIEYLRRNPIFWSRLGYELESGGWEPHVINAGRHKTFYEKGIEVHSSIIPIGWVGPDQYDYTETDKYFELLFSTCPDLVFLPRIKLNVPKGWCEANPDDVFVYGCGPRKREDIIAMLGTEAHGSHPFKLTDMIAQQSFFSKKWIADASEALRRFIEHTESSQWADRIIGYHLAYGTSGETTQWGTWNPDPFHKGDYGINATKAFIEYAAERGKTYDAVPPIEERFYIEEGGTPYDFQVGTPTLDQLFFHTEKDEQSILYAEFHADGNVDAIEAFGKVVRELVPQKVIGAFYGYLLGHAKAANFQHAGLERILNSPYVDFIASPKGYARVSPTDPGLGQAIPNSVNLKKLWVDEIDNRTHICTNLSRPQHDFPAKNFDQTRAVYWREFTKNVSHHQGYWWMDLGGGWLDSEEIQDEIVLMHKVSDQLYLEKESHKSVTEVLLLIDENNLFRMRPNCAVTAGLQNVGSVIKETGAPMDLYRVTDLPELDLSQYKVILFLNAFYEDHEKLQELLKKTRPDCHIIWDYAAGILNARDGSFGTQNIQKLTGFSVGEYPKGASPYEEPRHPVLYVNGQDGVTAVERHADGKIKTASRKASDGRTHILCTLPTDMTAESARALLEAAGVHLYAPAYCVVHADNRFLYLLSEKKQTVTVTFPHPTTCENIFTGERFDSVTTLTQEMEEGTCIFLKYLH